MIKPIGDFVRRSMAMARVEKLVIHRSATVDLKTSFGGYNRIMDRCLIRRSDIGRFSYIAADSRVIRAKVGKFASIGAFFRCHLGIHPLGANVSTHPSFFSDAPPVPKSFSVVPGVEEHRYVKDGFVVELGCDVWVGDNVTLLDGVTVGHGAVIGAGSVVTHDVPPYAIVTGVPGKVLRYRFDAEVRQKIINTAWWDWSPGELEEYATLFSDVTMFLDALSDR